MTGDARHVLRQALGEEQSGIAMLFQESQEEHLLAGMASSNEATTTSPTTTSRLNVRKKAAPTVREPSPSAQWRKCVDGKPNCGLLHDTMSMEWGKYKDLVDELQAEMDQNEDTWEVLKGNLNDQLSTISEAHGARDAQLAEAISNINSDNME